MENDYKVFTLKPSVQTKNTLNTDNWQEIPNEYEEPLFGAAKLEKDAADARALASEILSHSGYNDLRSKISVLVSEGYLPKIYANLDAMPSSMLNDLWLKYQLDLALKAGQPLLILGRSDEELAGDRWRRQLAVRLNLLNDAFTLNMNNSRWSDRFAYEHPDMVLKASLNNQITSGLINAASGIRGAGPILKGLGTIGLAFIPSTWLEGTMGYFGYTVPSWLSTGVDLAASAYWAKQAGDEFDRNGFTPYTVTNGVLSLLPITRSAEGISAVSNGLRDIVNNSKGAVKAVGEAVERMLPKGLTVSKAINQGVKDTKLVNVPVEHVTTNGVANRLNSYSESDVGFHLSPEGSPTTVTIQESTGMPFIRRGTWTYSDNTKPKVVTDNGNWTYDFNPELYSGTNPGLTNWENSLALDSKGPNFAYKNNFEGNGEVSYMTTSPNFGLSLSKNAELPKEVPTIAHKPGRPYSPFEDYINSFKNKSRKDSEGYKIINYLGFIGDNFYDVIKFPSSKYKIIMLDRNFNYKNLGEFETESEALNKLKELHSEAISEMNPLLRYMYLNLNTAKLRFPLEKDYLDGSILETINSYKDEEFTKLAKDYSLLAIEDIYFHPDYLDRFFKAVEDYDPSLDAGNIWEKFHNGLNKVQEEYIPIMTIPRNKNEAGVTFPIEPPIISLNPLAASFTDALMHEFGHGMYNNAYEKFFKFIKDYNKYVIGNPEYHLITPMAELNPKELTYLKYIINPLDRYDEFRQHLFTTVDEAIKNEWTAEQAYELSSNMRKFKKYFLKDYLVRVIAKLLAMMPVVSTLSNNDNN